MDWSTIIPTLAVALGASFTSGINVYATIAVLGLMHRYVDAFTLPGDLQVLGSHWIIWPAAFMYTIEFFADKIPAVDSAWDTIHTFIRVPAGAVIAAASLGDVPVAMELGAALIGGTLAFGSHTTKATTRLAAHSTGTSPVASPAASIVEDVAVVGLLGLVAANPVLSLFVLAGLLILAYFTLRMFWSLARKAIKAMTSWGGSKSDPAPVIP